MFEMIDMQIWILHIFTCIETSHYTAYMDNYVTVKNPISHFNIEW